MKAKNLTKVSTHIFKSVLFAALTACNQAQNQNADVASAQPVDSLTAQKWCTIEVVTDGLQIVSRFTFTRNPDQVQTEYFDADDSVNFGGYSRVTRTSWSPKTNEKFAPVGSYSLEVIDGKDNVEATKGYSEQEYFFRSLATTKSSSNFTAPVFKPKSGVLIRSTSFLSMEQSAQTLFPCSSYSTKFESVIASRPVFELALLLSESKNRSNVDHSSAFARSMELQFPLTLKNTSEINLEGSSWCSWDNAFENSLDGQVISFNKDRYIKSDINDINLDDYDSEPQIDMINYLVKEARISSITENDHYLKGESNDLLSNGSPLKTNDVFAFLQDSAGTQVLVSMYSPDALLLDTKAVHYKCSDSRPRRFSKGINLNLDKFISTQKARLERLK